MKTFELKKQGEKFSILTSAVDTNGGLVEMAFSFAPGAYGPQPHIHLKQVEVFEVLSGRMIATVDRKEHVVEAGQTIEVRAGQAHTLRNGSLDTPLELRVRYEPALHIEWFLTESAESAMRNGGSWKDLPPLEAAYLLYQVRDEYRLAGLPFFLQDVLFGLMTAIAKATGKSKNIRPLNK